MRNHMSGAGRWIAVLALAIGLVVGTYAFTAANTVPPTKAGDGSGAITGYTVSNVHYTLSGTDFSNIDTVAFTVDTAPPSGSTMKAQLVSGGSWYSCTNSTTTVTCTTTGATVVPANMLHIVIVD